MKVELVIKNYYSLDVKEGCEEELLELLNGDDSPVSDIVDMINDNHSLTEVKNTASYADVEVIDIDEETEDEESVLAFEDIDLRE